MIGVILKVVVICLWIFDVNLLLLEDCKRLFEPIGNLFCHIVHLLCVNVVLFKFAVEKLLSLQKVLLHHLFIIIILYLNHSHLQPFPLKITSLQRWLIIINSFYPIFILLHFYFSNFKLDQNTSLEVYASEHSIKGWWQTIHTLAISEIDENHRWKGVSLFIILDRESIVFYTVSIIWW